MYQLRTVLEYIFGTVYTCIICLDGAIQGPNLQILFFKGLAACCHPFLYLFYINRADIQYLYKLLFEYRVSSCCPHGFWSAEPRFELGPALQQDDALPSEPRRQILQGRSPESYFCFHSPIGTNVTSAFTATT
jgi:hypothetical protein